MTDGKIDAPSGIVALSVDSLIANILNTVYGVVGVVAVVMIIFGAFMYTTSAGDAKKIEQAKSTITYAVIGLVVVMLASAVTYFVIENV